MKQIINIVIITLFAFTLTGCNNKNLKVTCTKDGEVMIVNFENNNIVKVIKEITQTSENENLLNMAYQSAQMIVSAYNDINGASAEITKNNNSFTMKLTLNIKQMDKEAVEEANFNKNYKTFMKDTKADGYTCKAK